MLALEPGRGRLLDTVPGEKWRARSTLRTSGPLPANPTPEEYDAPAMYLREYHDVVCLPRQLVVQRGLVLPRPSRRWSRTASATRSSPRPASTSPSRRPGWTPPSRCPDAGSTSTTTWSGTSGTRSPSSCLHLWGWHRARRARPVAAGAGVRRVRVAHRVAARPPRRRRRRPRRRCTWARRHCGSRRWSGAPPCSAVRPSCTPRSGRRTTRSARALEARAGERPGPRRVFLGRRSAKRACINAEELVAEFTAAGFEVVYPEDHPLADQVAMVRRAEVVAGYAGSAHVPRRAGRPAHAGGRGRPPSPTRPTTST